MSLAVVIMAAGQGSRMKSKTPKVLHEVGKKPILGHILDGCVALNPEKIIVVYNHPIVKDFVSAYTPQAVLAEQTEQLGTGHAAKMAAPLLDDFSGDVMIVNGDTPLITEVLPRLASSHQSQQNDITLTSVFMEDPTGLGRIIRDDADNFQAIVEHKDASDAQRLITEINVGLYIGKAALVFELLGTLSNNNAQHEYYITDIAALGLKAGKAVGTFTYEDPDMLQGVNTRLHLAICEDLFQNMKREEMMAGGVTLTDPQSVFFAADTQIASDVTIGPNVTFGPGVTIETAVAIEGNAVISQTTIAEGSYIKAFSHLDGAQIAENCTVGPFARLRPTTTLQRGVKIGNFVEVKQSTIGENTAASHLSYLGNATIGAGCNIGAGTITANYDGANKFETTIEDDVFIGSQTVVVAPATLKRGATTAAGSIITRDVPAGTLVISKVKREERIHYQRPQKKSAK